MTHGHSRDHEGQPHQHQGGARAHVARRDPPRGDLRAVHRMSQRRVLDVELLLQIAQHLLLTL